MSTSLPNPAAPPANAPRHRSIKAKLAHAGLPAETTALIYDVVRKTRLNRRENRGVADELIAHFHDAVAAHIDPVQARNDFGDPATAAKLIRRAKIRLRSPLWHVWVWFRRGVAVAVLLYAALTIRFFTGTPTVAYDYFNDFNAAALALPEHERAWPIYRDAWNATQHDNLWSSLTTGHTLTVIRPEDPAWPNAKRVLHNSRQFLDTIRRAAAMPGLGIEWRPLQEIAPADRALLVGGATIGHRATGLGYDRAKELAENSIFYVNQKNRLGFRFIETSIALTADTDYAVQQGDQARAQHNLKALLGLHRHATDALRGKYPARQIFETASRKAQDILIETPDFWSDADLVALKGVFEKARLNPAISSGAQRAAFYDLVQRIYTDNGRGNGRITPEGLQVLAYLNARGSQAETGWADGGPEGYWTIKAATHAAMPRFLLSNPSRKKALASIDAWIPQDHPDTSRPLWQLLPEIADAAPARTGRQRPRPSFLDPWISEFSPNLIDTEKAEAAREGTLIAIAIEQYRRRHGNWPIQLEDLVPDHLTRLPVDRINGEPLQYRMTDEGPRIYSVGGDRDDDGGNIARGRPNQPIERGIAAFWFASYRDNPYFDGDWLLYPSPTRLPEAFLKQTSAELDQDPKQIRLH